MDVVFFCVFWEVVCDVGNVRMSGVCADGREYFVVIFRRIIYLGKHKQNVFPV